MQRAAHGLAYAVLDLLGTAYGRRVLLLVGSGDNGGDALYAGALLARRGVAVEAWLLTDRAHEAGLAALVEARGRRQVERIGRPAGPGRRRHRRASAAAPASAPMRRRPSRRLDGVPVVAVDTPSGVDVDTGELDGPHVTAAVTVTFGTHKVAHLVDPAATAAASVHLVDIGLDLPPRRPWSRCSPLTSPRCCRGRPPTRTSTPAASSGPGRLERRTPAPRCSAWPEPACGLAGMVRYVGDAEVATRVRETHPEVVGDGQVQAWVVGSGSGDGAEAALDAALADDVPLRGGRRRADPREAGARRTRSCSRRTPASWPGCSAPTATCVEAQPLRYARDAAEQYAAVVLLKGRHTLIAAPDGRVRVTTTGTPWLATAGAGDVLGGLIGALLATGLSDVRRRLGRLLAARRRGHPRRPRRPDRRRRRGAGHPGRGEPPPSPRRDGTIGTHDPERSRRDRGRPRRDPAQRAAGAPDDRGADDRGRQGRRLRPRHARVRPGRARRRARSG